MELAPYMAQALNYGNFADFAPFSALES